VYFPHHEVGTALPIRCRVLPAPWGGYCLTNSLPCTSRTMRWVLPYQGRGHCPTLEVDIALCNRNVCTYCSTSFTQ
jgi:hypothetical protein